MKEKHFEIEYDKRDDLQPYRVIIVNKYSKVIVAFYRTEEEAKARIIEEKKLLGYI